MTRISLIFTVLHEAGSIANLLDSILEQTRQPDEVVVVDGGSRDGTVAVLERYATRLPLRVLVEPGANISRGRNLAIQAATGDLIAATDAGVRLEPTWLAELTGPFFGPDPPDVVSGFFVADPQTPFQVAMGATVLPDLDEIDPVRFLPSSRSVAFRRAVWAHAGGYPEWLDYCEDLVFDLELRRAGCRFAFAPRAVVHFRPRPTLAAFFRQYYRYARGDGKANLWLRRHLIRYASYVGGAAILVAAWRWPGLLLALAAGGAAYLHRPYLRLVRPDQRPLPFREGGRRGLGPGGGRSVSAPLAAFALIPLIRVTGDLAKMIGYPVGCWWRWRRRLRQDRSGLTPGASSGNTRR